MKDLIRILLLLLIFQQCHAQIPSGIAADSARSVHLSRDLHFNYKQLIIPVSLIGFGFLAIENHTIQSINSQISEEVQEHIDKKFTIDDISQFAPAATVYVLNAAGVKGNHNLRDRSIILASGFLMMTATVTGLKSITHVERPDGSSRNSFPSGHTATAFLGAEFLMQEYKDVSVWYGVAGYAVAAGTGAFRIYNNRHWLTDVAAGAGIGILSAKAAYWIYPWMRDKVFKFHNTNSSVMLMPFYNNKTSGVGLVWTY